MSKLRAYQTAAMLLIVAAPTFHYDVPLKKRRLDKDWKQREKPRKKGKKK